MKTTAHVPFCLIVLLLIFTIAPAVFYGAKGYEVTTAKKASIKMRAKNSLTFYELSLVKEYYPQQYKKWADSSPLSFIY